MLFSIDNRPTLSRTDARDVYDKFAQTGHAGGKDASSGYGGPAIRALLSMAALISTPKTNFVNKSMTVLDYGCGQCKLAQLVLSDSNHVVKKWHGVDQSPIMIEKAKERMAPFDDLVDVQLLEGGEPMDVLATTTTTTSSNKQQHAIQPKSIDTFISTYCLDLLSEKDMHSTLHLAERVIKPSPQSRVILAGITWGYKRGSVKTFLMTLVWEFLYIFFRKKVGGCRPQNLEPYLKARGWEIVESVRTMPDSFPWMISEVISARPPSCLNENGGGCA